MKWALIALAGVCLVGLILLVREVRSGGGSPVTTTDKPVRRDRSPPPPDQPPDEFAPKARPGPGPAPLPDDPVDVDPPVEADTGPTSAELAATAVVAERIEDEDAPRQLRRIAMQCEQPGKKLEGTMYLTLTLDSGNGQIQVNELNIKDSSLDADMQTCVQARLANARWQQPDAPDRRWRIGIALALPE